MLGNLNWREVFDLRLFFTNDIPAIWRWIQHGTTKHQAIALPGPRPEGTRNQPDDGIPDVWADDMEIEDIPDDPFAPTVDILQWIQRIDKLILRAWIACMRSHGEDAGVTIVKVTRGPLTVSFGLKLLLHSNKVANTAKSELAIHISTATGIDGDHVGVSVDSSGIIWVDLPSPEPIQVSGEMLSKLTPVGVDLADRTPDNRSDIVATVALDRKSKPVRIPFSEFPIVSFIGPPRQGKTSGLVSALYTLCANNDPDRVRILVFAVRNDDWLAWQDTPHFDGVYTDKEEILRRMEYIAQSEVVNRSNNMWGDYPSLIIVYDDFTGLAPSKNADKKRFLEAHKSIALAGGATRVYTVMTTHSAGSKGAMGDINVENSANYRILYNAPTEQSNYMNSGKAGVTADGLTDRKGDAIVLAKGRPIRAATGFTHPDKIREIGGEWDGGDRGSVESLRTLPPQNEGNGVNTSGREVNRSHNEGNGDLEGNGVVNPVNPSVNRMVNGVNTLDDLPSELSTSDRLGDNVCVMIYNIVESGIAKTAIAKHLYGGNGKGRFFGKVKEHYDRGQSIVEATHLDEQDKTPTGFTIDDILGGGDD